MTPAAVEHAFAHRGVLVTRVAQPPELCDRQACSSLYAWGGRTVYLAPAGKADFFLALFARTADARAVARLRRLAGVGAVTRGSILLEYLRSSPRLARLRAALASLP